jgi:maltose-binding protein MalE
MKFIQKNILLVVAAVVVLGGGFFYLSQDKVESPKSTTSSTQEKVEVTKVTTKYDGQEESYEVKNAVGKTALEVTEEAVAVEKSGEGKDAFITSINGRRAEDSKREFWKLVINGEDAQVGAGSYTIEKNDSIVWEIDTY